MAALVLDFDKRSHLSSRSYVMQIPLNGIVPFVLELAREPWGYSLEDANSLVEACEHLKGALLLIDEACRIRGDVRHLLETAYELCLSADGALAMVSEKDDSTVRQLRHCLNRIQDAVIKALCD